MTEGLRMGTGLPPGHVGHILELDSGDGCAVMGSLPLTVLSNGVNSASCVFSHNDKWK